MKKKYSYNDRLNYYGKLYKQLKTKQQLNPKEYGKMLYAKGYCDIALNKFDETLSSKSMVYRAGWLNSAKAKEKAFDFKF